MEQLKRFKIHRLCKAIPRYDVVEVRTIVTKNKKTGTFQKQNIRQF